MLICAMMTSISIVREKEVGTMELLLVSPTRPIFVIFAKMAPYFTLSIVNYITILLLSVFVLQIPITGSLLWLTVISLIYIFLALAVGLFISTIMATQVAAMIASLGILMFPTILLSGMLYPLENAPLILQYLSCIFPARWYISAVRKIMIEGLPIHYVATEVSILIGMSVVMITLSLKKFKNRLE
jgi:ABC-2 type transport system permease protein